MAKYFRLTLSGNYFGSNWANVWHYLSSSNDSGQADNLIAEFQTQMFNAIRGIMNNQVSITQLHAVDVPDTGDFATAAFAGLNGSFGANGTKLPPAYTMAYTLNTLNSPIRHGFKRFVGQDEDMIAAGVPSTAFDTASTTLIAKFDDILENGDYSFTPVVVRYAGDPAEIVLHTPIVGGFFKRFGYQRTRES